MQPLKSILDRVDSFLKNDLLGDRLELLIAQPAPIRRRPGFEADIQPLVSTAPERLALNSWNHCFGPRHRPAV
jgi:hypothetical protein